MRVIIICDQAHVNGGAAKVAIRSARGLADAGIPVLFACAIGPVATELTHPNIRVALMDAPDIWQIRNPAKAAATGIWNAAAGRWLAALLEREKTPDTVVHVHHWTRAFSPAGLAAIARSGLPVCLTMHNYFSFCPNGAYFNFRTDSPCRLTPMGARCVASHCARGSYAHKGVRVARQWPTDRAFAAMRRLMIVHVAAFAEDFARRFCPPQAQHVLVPNMIDAPERPPVAPEQAAPVLFVGRLESEKGPHILAAGGRAAGQTVRFLGSGPMDAAIRAANPDAELLGWQPPEAVYDIIASARAVIAPSLWFEPGPLVIAEAQALGVPGVVSTATGAASSVRPGETGLRLDTVSVASLTAALDTLADDALVARMGRAAHAGFWAAPLTTARHTQESLGAYDRLLRGAG